MAYNIVAETTNSLLFQLLENGIPIDLTGITVTLLLEDRTGTAIAAPGAITVTDNTNGKVKLVPTDATTFTASTGPYFARWKLTDGFGKVSFVPSANRDQWNVVGK